MFPILLRLPLKSVRNRINARFQRHTPAPWLFVFLLSSFALAPLAYPGFFQTHAGFLPVWNLIELGAQPWGWAPPIGGYDPMASGGPLPYFIGQPLVLCGLSSLVAVKTVFALSLVVSGLSLFAFARRLLGDRAAIVTALIYVYLPYQLSTVYVRGDLSESVFLALLPLSLLLADRAAASNSLRLLCACVLACASLVLSHAGLGLLGIVLILVYVVALRRGAAGFRNAILGPVIGASMGFALLSPLFLIPTSDPAACPRDPLAHLLFPFQLFSTQWGYGTSQQGWQDIMSFQIGVVPLGLSLLGIALLWNRKGGETRPLFVVFGATSLVMSILTLGLTEPVWRLTGLHKLMCYPWQLLGLVGLGASIMAGTILALERRLTSFPLWAAMVSLVVLGSYSYLNPQFTDLEVTSPPLGILDEKVALIDYQQEGPLRHGATVRLTLHWQCLVPPEEDLMVFVHVVDDAEIIWGQRDREPLEGEHPTSKWTRGELIEDRYKVQIKLDGPREGYRIAVGMYSPTTAVRLPAADGQTRIILPERR